MHSRRALFACTVFTFTSGLAVAQLPAPPFITTEFAATSVALGGTTSLTFTITTTDVLFGVAFTDTLPTGLVVATPNGLTGSCGLGGTVTATPGSNSVSLSGALLRANSSCTFSVNVTGMKSGIQNIA